MPPEICDGPYVLSATHTTAELSVFTDDEGAHVMRSDAGLGLRFTDVSGASSADLPCYEEWVIVA
jgi:hypothetical protein